jgi:hypothetical protein
MVAGIAALLLVTFSGGPLPVEVSVPIPAPGGGAEVLPCQLTPADDPASKPLPAQVCTIGPWGGDGECLAFILPPDSPAGKATYAAGSCEPYEPAFRFDQDDAHLRLFEGDRPALTYNFGMMLPEGVPENRRRSSYVHPLYGLDGEIISDDFPKDHYHHRGLFWSWPKITVGDRNYDLWAISGVLTQFEEWLGREVGPVCAVFGVRNGWYVGEERTMEETVWFRVWRAGEVGQAIDVALKWEAQKEPVTINPKDAKGYGGLCLRFGPREDTVLTTVQGKQDQDSNLQPSPWADLSARFGGRAQASGAAVFIDADNPAFPNGWCLRHYGFLGVNWPGADTFTLRPGEPVELRYRVWVHRGGADDGVVSAAYESFAEPPDVTVSE